MAIDFYKAKEKITQDRIARNNPVYAADRELVEGFENSLTGKKVEQYLAIPDEEKDGVKMMLTPKERGDIYDYFMAKHRKNRAEIEEAMGGEPISFMLDESEIDEDTQIALNRMDDDLSFY